MHILVIGQGAREHALAWKFLQSPLARKISVWPGNAAMQGVAEFFPLASSASLEALAEACREQAVDLVVCGPEAPLAAGLQNVFAHQPQAGRSQGEGTAPWSSRVFGPSKEAAQLEASKAFAKEIMTEAGIPTAPYHLSTSKNQTLELALTELEKNGAVVLKASGLASGKGVFVCKTRGEIDEALALLYGPQMAKAAETVVVETCLSGPESSYFCLWGSQQRYSLGFAVDFKRAEEGDRGFNTGGMGAYTPVPWLNESEAEAQMQELVLGPLEKALAKRGISYQGFLYVGLMWTKAGPSVIEFNVRLGDPEAQVLAMHDPRDWLALIVQSLGLQAPEPALASVSSERTPRRTVGFVIASQSYPLGEATQAELQPAPFPSWVFSPNSERRGVFGASVRADDTGQILPGRGRVLTVAASATSFKEAREEALKAVNSIHPYWPSGKWRNDIAAAVATQE